MKICQLLNRKSKWCKGAEARDRQGKPVPALSKSAVEWDLVGAAVKCYRGNKFNRAMDAIRDAAETMVVSGWNDRATWPQVRKVILKAKV